MKSEETGMSWDTFGEIMDVILKNRDERLEIHIPAGTMDAEVTGTRLGPVVDFYVLLDAVKPLYQAMLEELDEFNIDRDQLAEALCGLIRDELTDGKGYSARLMDADDLKKLKEGDVYWKEWITPDGEEYHLIPVLISVDTDGQLVEVDIEGEEALEDQKAEDVLYDLDGKVMGMRRTWTKKPTASQLLNTPWPEHEDRSCRGCRYNKENGKKCPKRLRRESYGYCDKWEADNGE